jgi:methyl-accepting chemotaxis protein
MNRSLEDVIAGDTAVCAIRDRFGRIATSIDEVTSRISDIASTTQE